MPPPSGLCRVRSIGRVRWVNMSDIRPIIFAEFPIKTKFSCDGEKKYRYLWKAQIINQSGNGKIVTFVMLNPSTADENSEK